MERNTHKNKVLRGTRFNHHTPPRLPPIVPATFCSPVVIALYLLFIMKVMMMNADYFLLSLDKDSKHLSCLIFHPEVKRQCTHWQPVHMQRNQNSLCNFSVQKFFLCKTLHHNTIVVYRMYWVVARTFLGCTGWLLGYC